MKINGNILKSFDSTVENKQKKKLIGNSQNPESIKSDTLNISSNQVNDVVFPSFDEAKNLLNDISKHIKENPESLKSLHDKTSAENISFLLRK